MFQKALNYSLYLLTYRARTVAEIKDKLRKKKYEQKIIDEVINKLQGLGYLNDVEFAKNYLQTKKLNKPAGRKKIKMELYQKGVNKEIIEEVLQEFNEEEEKEMALKIASQRINRYNKLNNEKRMLKIFSFLQRKGFSQDTISFVLRKIKETEVV